MGMLFFLDTKEIEEDSREGAANESERFATDSKEKGILVRQNGQLIIAQRGAPLKARILFSAPKEKAYRWVCFFFLDTKEIEEDSREGAANESERFAADNKTHTRFPTVCAQVYHIIFPTFHPQLLRPLRSQKRS